jgi:hypothetical protein
VTLRKFLADNGVESFYQFEGYPGVTVEEIKKAQRLQQAFQQVLDDPAAEKALQHPALKPLLEQAAD